MRLCSGRSVALQGHGVAALVTGPDSYHDVGVTVWPRFACPFLSSSPSSYYALLRIRRSCLGSIATGPLEWPLRLAFLDRHAYKRSPLPLAVVLFLSKATYTSQVQVQASPCCISNINCSSSPNMPAGYSSSSSSGYYSRPSCMHIRYEVGQRLTGD